jgi:tetratricopeptide (TPR) repeat protein
MTSLLLLGLLLQTPPASDATAAFREGNAAFEKRENEAALAAYDRAIALDPKVADYHLARCRTLARLLRHEDAVASCSTAIDLQPDNAAALIDRGHFYVNLRKVEQALADLTRAEAAGNDDYGLWYHLALARYLSGEFAKAADTYVNCVRTAPTADNRTACQAWQYLALRRAGRDADAQKLLDGFAPAADQAPSAYIDRLLLFKGTKTEAEVAQAMEKDAVQLPTVAYSLGMWHLLNGREARAREYFDKALTPPAQASAFGAVASFVERERMAR